MAKKISELGQLQYSDLANDDYFQIIDESDPLYGNTGTNKRMLVGDFKQAIFVSPTLTGHIQLPQQSGQNLGDNSALTIGMGNSRYGQSYFNERLTTLPKTNDTTLTDVLSLTLPTGEYHIDILLGSNTGAGGAKIAFVHDRPNNRSTFHFHLVEEYGTNNSSLVSTVQIAETTVGPITPGVDPLDIISPRTFSTAGTHIYRLSGIMEIKPLVGSSSATLKVQYAQNTSNAAASTLRIKSYFMARRVA